MIESKQAAVLPDTDAPVQGFLLTHHSVERPSGLELRFWLSTPQGPLLAVVPEQESVFFVRQADVEQISQILVGLQGWRMQSLELINPAGEPVSGLYVKRQATLSEARTRLAAQQINCYEDDVRVAERYLMERFVCGSVQLRGRQSKASGYSRIDRAAIKPSEYLPQLKLLSIDIETTMRADQIFSIGLYGKAPGGELIERVLMVGQGPADPLIDYVADERALLLAFVAAVAEFDPDVLIGWNVVGFDLSVLQQRADVLRVALKLGRAGERLRLREGRGNLRFASIAGRVVVDGIDGLKAATYSFESFALENVARQLLGRGKQIDSSDAGIENRGGEIARLFEHDKPALAAYNIEDCRLVWDIFGHTRLLDYLIERSRLTGLPLDKIGGSAAAFDNLYLPRLHRGGYVAPVYASGEAGMSSPGGYVMDSRPGLYDHVLVLDFKSLYPSIIRTFRVDPQGLFVGLDQHLRDDASEPVPGFNGAWFDRQRHILPGLLKTLWQARDRAKAENNDPVSRAIKIIMNSFYGVLGSPQCRFFDHRLSGSITLRGHQILTESRDYIGQQSDDSMVYTVIYGDTDSLFIWLQPQQLDSVSSSPVASGVGAEQGLMGADPNLDKPQIDAQTINAIGDQLAQQLNRWWAERLQQEFALESFLEIEFETHYQRFLMPTIRGSDRGSKKRYAGLVLHRQGDDDEHAEMVYKGLEAVRSDWTPLAREFQQQLYRKVFLDQPYQAYLQGEVAALLAGQRDEQLVYNKRLRRPLAEYVKSQPPQVQAARMAERHRQQRGLPSRYRRGSSVAYVITTQGAQPVDYRSAPIDYRHYLEKQLAPIADAILPFVGDSFGGLVEQQMQLF
ncbi:MAG: DNA polymerase II [Halopseudomonas sp.]